MNLRVMGRISKKTTSLLLWSLLLLLLTSFLLNGCAGKKKIKVSAIQTYYSVHLESFREIKNANRYVNDLSNKGKFVFWEIAHVEGLKYHRVFVGRFSNRADAEEYRLKLKAEFAEKEPNKPLKIHEFHETPRATQSPLKESRANDPTGRP